ncbi:MAG: NADAR family protein [Lacrimispora celerecrescens]|nr:NADAR family protein [Lacrimispora celerecrescens]
MAIYFYKTNDKYGCFSNFSKHGFEIKGKYWMTSEHFFQAQKFVGTEFEEQIRLLTSPMEAANMGRDRSIPLRHDWEEVKNDIMRRAVFEKFKTNIEAKKTLLLTGDEEIIEKTTSDFYWGCGEDGTGINMLGKILMETRDILR